LNQSKQIVIDLCKLAWAGYFIFSAFLLFVLIDAYSFSPHQVESIDNHYTCSPNDPEPQSGNTYCNSDGKTVFVKQCAIPIWGASWCLDMKHVDMEWFYVGYGHFVPDITTFMILNCINFGVMFLIINNKYKTFAYKICSGIILNLNDNIPKESAKN